MLRIRLEGLRGWFEKNIINLIRLYRYGFSLLLGDCCRFYPSCSVYAEQAIAEWGIIRGIAIVMKRLLRCHPGCSGGVDTVPFNPFNSRKQ